jgi:endonuclease/exonuclease/phosphatase family metal-dependent hydrolase
LSSLNIRVMTFNLLTSTKQKRRHPWRLRKRNIARIFDQWQPDVVGTQEANFQQLKELADLLPDYDFLGEGNLGSSMEHSDKNWYCATFYRRDRVRPMDSSGISEALWLSPTPDVPASQFHLGTRPRLVTWNNFELIGSAQPFVFGTTHLEAVNGWHRQKSAAQLRRHVSQKVEELGEDIPVFLTGDFNAVAQSPEIKALVDQERDHEPLFDAWAEAHGNESPEGATFRGLGLRDRLGHALLGPRRIDYVFFRPRMEIRTVQRVDFGGMDHRQSSLPSDHYPVCADFQLVR